MENKSSINSTSANSTSQSTPDEIFIAEDHPNAKNFVNEVRSSGNSYYSFVGLPNPTNYQSNWDVDPPSPKDNFDEENNYWDTMIALNKLFGCEKGGF